MKRKYTCINLKWLLPVFVLAVFALAAAPLFTGCSKSSSGAQTTAQATDKMTSLRIMQQDMDNQQMDWPNLWHYQEIEKKTGVRVTWDLVMPDAWNTRVNLAFASMDLPDLIRSGRVDVEEYGVYQKLLVPLDPYLKDHMPIYYSRLFMNDADKSMYSSDGQMYYIGNLMAQNVNHTGNHYINKTWLDTLGLEIPKTIDELTTVLRAFRDRAPNGNPQTVLPMSAGGSGTRPMSDLTQGIAPHFAMFGVPYTNNGAYGAFAAITPSNRVQFVTDYPGYRDAVEWFAMAYSERLLDMESITQDSNAWGVKMNAGRVGFTAYLRLINTALTEDTAKNYVSILPPASRHGVQVPRLTELAGLDTVVTIANKYVAQSLEWMDLQFETETMMVAYNGPVREGGPIPPTMRLLPNGSYDIHTVPANNGLYNIVPVLRAPFFAPADYYTQVYNMPPHRVERYQTSLDYANAGVLEPGSYSILYSLLKPSNAEAIELDRLYTDIDRLMQESLADFIRTGVTQARWDTFIRTLDNVGKPRYVELLQKNYDAYLASTK